MSSPSHPLGRVIVTRTGRPQPRNDEAGRPKRRARRESVDKLFERWSENPTALGFRDLLERATQRRSYEGKRDVVRLLLERALPILAPRIPTMTAADTAVLMEAVGRLAAHRKSIEMRRTLMRLLLQQALEVVASFDAESLARACNSFGGSWLDDTLQRDAAVFLGTSLQRATAMVPALTTHQLSAMTYAAGLLPLDDDHREHARAFIEAVLPRALAHARDFNATELTSTIAPFERLQFGDGARRQAAALVRAALPWIPLPEQTSLLLSIVRRSLLLPLDDEGFRAVGEFARGMLRPGPATGPDLIEARVESLTSLLDELPLEAGRRQEFLACIGERRGTQFAI